ncbi:MAG: hypothetical protein JXR34_11475 [Bacteroidales bacterium]|nr:hypothetical protein [Bacteroidales bacterium]
MEPINQIHEALHKVSQALVEIGKYIANAMKPYVSFIKERKIQNLTKDGWYLSVKFLDTFGTIADSIYIGNNWEDEKVKLLFYNRVLEFIDEYALQIKAKMDNNYPERSQISNELFGQFINRNNYSFITLCLSQINGISKKEIGIDFFSSSNSEQSIGKSTEANSMFELIKLQIQTGDRNHLELLRKDYIGDGLNRHAIMHGESLNYGSEENAIKALLLLDFVIELCDDWKEASKKWNHSKITS